jgi:PIN domain nuclease of toxin-antitoxin system
MRILLDTHILLWFLNDSTELSPKSISLLKEADEVYASTVNIWEIVVKYSIGKLRIKFQVHNLLDIINDSGLKILNIKPEHALKLVDLENYHKDPFDRLLISQSLVEPLHLLTSDSLIAQYKGNVIKI